MKLSFHSTVLALALGCTPASAFPYGSYLRSLSNPQPAPDPDPVAIASKSSSSSPPSSWDDYNPNPLSANVGGPVIPSVAKQSVQDAQDRFLDSSTTGSGQSTTTNGFGQPPYSSSKATNGSRQPSTPVDPYVAAYAAFQKSMPESSGKVATVNFSLSAQPSEEAKTLVDRDSKSRKGVGSSYLDALASSGATAVPEKVGAAETKADTKQPTKSFMYRGPSIGGQEPYVSLWESRTNAVKPDFAVDAPVLAKETEVSNSVVSEPVVIEAPPVVKEDETPTIPDPMTNPFSTGNSFFAAYSDTVTDSSTPDAVQTSIAENKSAPPTTRSKKPFGADSYLENLANNVVVDEDVEPTLSAGVSSVENPSTSTTSTTLPLQRPLIPIHAIKVVELTPPQQQGHYTEEKPFFATFTPKAPIRPRGRSPVPKDLTKSRLERIMSRTSDVQ